MGNKDVQTKKQELGKGGAFETRKNPFQQKRVGGFPLADTKTMLGGALAAVLRAECAVIFGTTRDGGALCITILDGEDRHRTYCGNDEELQDALRAMIENYT